MAANVVVNGFQDSKYFARSWALLTEEPGWFSRVFLLWIAGLVPIVGPLGVMGYVAEWSRLTAWNVNSSPSHNGGTIGGYIKSGWRAFLVCIGWALAWALIVSILEALPIVGVAVSPVVAIVGAFVGLVISVAVLRATIYQQVGPGYGVSTIFKMVENDAAGLLRIWGISLVGGLILAVIATIVFIVVLIPSATTISSTATAFLEAIDRYGNVDDITIGLMVEFLVSILPAFMATVAISAFFGTILDVILHIAVGLWIRQYNVPAWGGPDDPLPIQTSYDQQQYYQQQYSVPQQPYDPNGAYQDPNQVPYAYGNTDYGQNTAGSVGQAYTPPTQQGNNGQYPWQQ